MSDPEGPPHVLLDATVATATRAGVGRYIDELVAALSKRDQRLTVVCHARDEDYFRRLAPGVSLHVAPKMVDRRPVRLLWEQLALPWLVRRYRADVLHSPHYTMPLLCRRPVVVTLHDATFFTHPTVHEPLKRVFFKAWTRMSLRRAAACITPSAATKSELMRVAGARADRVAVAHLGVASATFRVPTSDERQAVRAHLGISGRYVAFLGTLEPRKNVDELIRGWVMACADEEDPPALILSGKQGWGEGLEEVIRSVPPQLNLVLAGYLPIELLAGFLGEAEVVAYPSLGEGFGLPVLEAMSCGAAVLTTPRLSLPEVGGRAVAYTEPDSPSIALRLVSLLRSPEERAGLRAAAVERAARFSWDACAAAHIAVYARAR